MIRKEQTRKGVYMQEKLQIGVIGLGSRGMGLLKAVMLEMEDIEVTAVCDVYQDRQEDAAAACKEKYGKEVTMTGDYHEILAMDGVDAVIISASWAAHSRIAVDAMRAGKPCASEVGGAYSLEECWELVRTHEETGVPCMMLENCCYGRDELMVLNMVKQGVLGEIVHCAGGYCHDLRKEIAEGRENRHYRLDNYMHRNCENYPTHELGPIAKVLDINRGNRMVSLSSVASKARGMNEYAANHNHAELADYPFAQGDIVTTTIRCAHGETIVLTLDTTLPRAYSRGFTVRGTKGLYQEDTRSIFIDGMHEKFEFNLKGMWGNAEEFREQYEHPIWKQYLAEGVKGGHDGMDWLVFSAFFDSVRQGETPPIDVYDMASWMAVTALSEQSVAMGGLPVAFPDFTNGRWIAREPIIERHFCLDKICE